MEKKMDFMLKLEQTMEKTFQIAYFSKVQSYSHLPRHVLIFSTDLNKSKEQDHPHIPVFGHNLVGETEWIAYNANKTVIYFLVFRDWSGILIEPNQESFVKIQLLNRKSLLLNTCISPSNYSGKISMLIGRSSRPIRDKLLKIFS